MSEFHFYKTNRPDTEYNNLARILAAVAIKEHGLCVEHIDMMQVPADFHIEIRTLPDGGMFIHVEPK